MSDPAPPPPAVREQTIREVQPGVIGAATEIARAVVGTMPPAFLMLLLINIGFLWLCLSFIEHQLDQRLGMVNRIVDHCIATTGRMPPPPAP